MIMSIKLQNCIPWQTYLYSKVLSSWQMNIMSKFFNPQAAILSAEVGNQPNSLEEMDKTATFMTSIVAFGFWKNFLAK